MKILSAIAAALFVCMIVVSCSSPTTTTPGPNPGGNAFTVTANIDGTPYSAGALMTIAPIPSTPPKNLVDLKSTSGSRSLEIVFIIPTNATFPVNITQPNFAATYTEGGASYQDSLGTATVTVNSFTKSYADTVFSADFLFKAKGGTGTLTIKDFTAGTVR
jgi:hypothetical protein